MVNAGKEFADVAFENVGGSGVVVGDFSCIRFKLLYGFMGSFVIPAGIGVIDKLGIEIGVQVTVDGVMD